MDWERLWAPYDEETYRAVLAWATPVDVVLDIGAGDLRLARRLAARVRHVTAVERSRAHLPGRLPALSNLEVVCGDARQVPFPPGLTMVVLLMRHCRHFAQYCVRAQAAGARWLITNARWGVGVERIDLSQAPIPFAAVQIGWYACRCGRTGFVPNEPVQLTPAVMETVHQVTGCPRCRGAPAVAAPAWNPRDDLAEPGLDG